MKKRVVAVCLCLALLMGIFPAAVGSVSAASGNWEKKQSVITTPWYDEITADTIPLDEYPNPQLQREDWLNLNGLWNFAGSASETAEPDSYSQQIMVPYAMESALSGIMQHYDYAWYNREFTLPADWDPDDRIILHFEAVDWMCSVYVNGTEVVTDHKGGYLPFSVDVTDALKDGVNTLSVKVFDNTDAEGMTNGKQRPNAGGIFYTSVSGIWGTVWMEPVSSQAYIEDTVVTTDIDNSTIGLTVNQAGEAAATVDVTVKAEDQVVATATGLPLNEENTIEIPQDQLYLWSPDTPFLYDLLLEVKVGGQVVDTVRSYVGMRKIELVDTGESDENGAIMMMYLNDEPIYQSGFLDQGYWPESLYTAPTDEALRWDIQAQKDLGYNMIRKHIKVESRRWYYYADKIGMIVWQDQPCGADAGIDFMDYRAETVEMVETLRNHPSIAVWIMYNEGWRQHSGLETQSLTNTIKALDPTRLVTPASGWNDAEAGDIKDNHHYPDPWPGLSGTRARVCGEFGGLTYVVEDHLWKGQDASYTADFETPERLLAGYEDLMAQCRNYKDGLGMSAQVYTQFTDLEGEINGIYTYDRKVLKVDEEAMFEVNQEMIRDGVIVKTGLQAAIDRVELKDQSLYSEASWAIVASAKAQAETVLADTGASQYEIYQAAESLLTALDELYALGSSSADKTALNIAIRDADARDTRDYTEDSVQGLPAALAAAKAVKSRSKATQEEVDAAAAALQKVLDELEYLPADKTELNAAVAQAEALEEFDHQPLTWQVLEAALADAKAVQADENAKRGAILDATEALNEALGGLVRFDEVKPTRYEAEQAALGTGVTQKSDTFFSNQGAVEGLIPIASIGSAADIAADWSNLRYVTFTVDAPAAGEYRLDIIYCTNTGGDIYIRVGDGESVPVKLEAGMLWNSMVTNSQTITLQKGQNTIRVSGPTAVGDSGDWVNLDCIDITLVTATGEPDKAALKAAIDQAEALKEADYTAASWENLTLTLTAAKRGYDNPDATVMQVEGLRQAVLSAIEALENKPVEADKADLKAAIAKAQALDESKYTEDSWADLTLALSEALSIDATAGVSQEDVDEAADALNQAIDALQEKGQPQQSGDVNGDGKVNSSDARLVLQYPVELIQLTEEQLARANMNGDTLVNSSDARMILQAAVGMTGESA